MWILIEMVVFWDNLLQIEENCLKSEPQFLRSKQGTHRVDTWLPPSCRYLFPANIYNIDHHFIQTPNTSCQPLLTAKQEGLPANHTWQTPEPHHSRNRKTPKSNFDRIASRPCVERMRETVTMQSVGSLGVRRPLTLTVLNFCKFTGYWSLKLL